MAVRKILLLEDPVLHKTCHPVTRFDARLADLLDDLKDTLADAQGAGLSAPQIGILRRVAVVALLEEGNGEMLELVNPEIIDQEGEDKALEGCLSVPGYYGIVARPTWVKVRAQDRKGNFFEAEGTGLTARCFCHEIAHLDGQLYLDLTTEIYSEEQVDEILRQKEELENQENSK